MQSRINLIIKFILFKVFCISISDEEERIYEKTEDFL